jgi:enoyl-CoA hydratase/3-hydroxyacyl-CoA dehydrogenase
MTAIKSLTLIDEPAPLLKERKGGGLNLILTALLVEAGRMLDEGMDVPTIEAAGKKAFLQNKGFLQQADERGVGKAVSLMENLADDSDEQDSFFLIYHNFFSPPRSLVKGPDRTDSSGGEEENLLVPQPDTLPGPSEMFTFELLTKRFQAVSFMVAVELIESGVADIQDLDRHCRTDLGWKEGPFTMMNRIGIQESLQMVVEKMQLSHRQEINFPVPKTMLEHAQKGAPWPLNNRIS